MINYIKPNPKEPPDPSKPGWKTVTTSRRKDKSTDPKTPVKKNTRSSSFSKEKPSPVIKNQIPKRRPQQPPKSQGVPPTSKETKNQAQNGSKRKEMSPQEKHDRIYNQRHKRMTYVTDSGTESQGITQEEMRDMWETFSPGQKAKSKFSNIRKLFEGENQPDEQKEPKSKQNSPAKSPAAGTSTAPAHQQEPNEPRKPEGNSNEENEDAPNGEPENNRDGDDDQEDDQQEEPEGTEAPETDKEFVVIMELRKEDRDVLKCPSDLEDLLQPITEKYEDLKEIKPNHPRSLIAFVFTSEAEARDLLKTTHINTEIEVLTVRCRWAMGETWNYGIVKGIMPPKSEEERTRRTRNMKEKLAKRGTPVTEITWIKKKITKQDSDEKELVETNTVRLEFVNDIPAKVYIGLSSYNVETYTPEVTQCYKCQGFGHIAKHCTHTFIKCLQCGRIGHKKADCRARNPRCANCAGPHKAWSKICPFYLKEVEALKIRGTSKTTIHAARTEAEEHFPTLSVKQENLDRLAAKRIANRSYAAATKNEENQRKEPEQETEQPKEQRKPRAPRRRQSRQKKEPTRQEAPRKKEHKPHNSRKSKQNQTEYFNQEKYTRQTIKTILPGIIIPLIEVLLQVATIPGDYQGKIEKVNEVAREAIAKACEEPLPEEDSSEDEDYEPSSEESEDSESSEDSELDMETETEPLTRTDQQRPGRTH